MSTEKDYHIFNHDNVTDHRRELLENLEIAIQDNGNTNVLLVHAISQHLGISAVEFECWSLIGEKGPFTAGELARKCRITTGGMTGMIDRLERRGYVRRCADPNDRRRVIVQAVRNEEAIEKARKLYRPLQQSFNELIEGYSDKELEFILQFMMRTNTLFHAAVDALPDKAS